MGTSSVRKDRNPRGMNIIVAERLNKWLVKNGHNDRSKSFMVTSGDPRLFGDEFFVFPMGKFKYT
jgi:hypothetical protein